MAIDKDEFEAKRDQFLATQDNTNKDEWYDTNRGFAEHVLNEFHEFLFDDKSKQQRRLRYLEAKKAIEELGKEFEGE